ncbi:MAG: GNAT family N-acetyltransferase [Clostridiales bacterium]|nr:GNAT family N-acetyltransferase [Clostridiales bacterium]MDY2834696.1 GNAT family N-acetyltransferase [Candidatus Aphodomonas sp.]
MERIVTESLTLEPMCCAEMAAHAAACREADPELSVAYREMLDGCRANPGQWLWYTAWKMLLRDGTEIGDACFKGFSADGRAEIGYGIGAAYWGRGYATEGAAALCRWALENGARTLEAEAAPENAASMRVLEKLGFRPTGETGAEGPRFALAGK